MAHVISKLKTHEDMLSPWKGECDGDQCPWWSNAYDTHLDSKRLGFDPLLRHRIFSDYVTYSTHCYIHCGDNQY